MLKTYCSILVKFKVFPALPPARPTSTTAKVYIPSNDRFLASQNLFLCIRLLS